MRILRPEKRRALRRQDGFTLIELMIVVAVIGVLSAISIPIYANVQVRARVAKAEADVRTLAGAVEVYEAHMGLLPGHLTDLTSQAVNGLNQSAGPFMASIPTPPQGGNPPWPPYGYYHLPGGRFHVWSSGDGVNVVRP